MNVGGISSHPLLYRGGYCRIVAVTVNGKAEKKSVLRLSYESSQFK
jgi:hypothetical protein